MRRSRPRIATDPARTRVEELLTGSEAPTVRPPSSARIRLAVRVEVRASDLPADPRRED